MIFNVQEEQPHTLLLRELPVHLPVPWCRVCRRGVRSVEWTRYPDGWWGFSVKCHGAAMDGIVATPTPGNVCHLEVFAYEEPHMKEGPWWWVDANGGRLQDSKKYNVMTVRPGFFSTRFAKWIHRNFGL